jgi:hypothetical protein
MKIKSVAPVTVPATSTPAVTYDEMHIKQIRVDFPNPSSAGSAVATMQLSDGTKFAPNSKEKPVRFPNLTAAAAADPRLAQAIDLITSVINDAYVAQNTPKVVTPPPAPTPAMPVNTVVPAPSPAPVVAAPAPAVAEPVVISVAPVVEPAAPAVVAAPTPAVASAEPATTPVAPVASVASVVAPTVNPVVAAPAPAPPA